MGSHRDALHDTVCPPVAEPSVRRAVEWFASSACMAVWSVCSLRIPVLMLASFGMWAGYILAVMPVLPPSPAPY